MSKNVIRYDEEFKQELIRLVKEEGRSIPKVAKDFGVNPQTLRNWIKKADDAEDPG